MPRSGAWLVRESSPLYDAAFVTGHALVVDGGLEAAGPNCVRTHARLPGHPGREPGDERPGLRHQVSVRRLEFKGCFNFRDLGGWRTQDGRTVRWGRLFRADSVHLMTESDCSRATDELDIKLLLDLRNEVEVATDGVGRLVDGGTKRLHLPLTSRTAESRIVDGTAAAAASPDRSPDVMVAGYLGMLDVSADLIVEALRALSADDALPAVFFCAAAKDRTGVLSAAVLGAVGVVDEDIVTDYLLSAETIGQVIGRFASRPEAPEFYRDLPAQNFAPQRETMKRVVTEVRARYGSFAEYALGNGLARADLDRLTDALVETR